MLQPITYPLTILHGPGHDYSKWDSLDGIRAAHAAGATALDVNGQQCKPELGKTLGEYVPTHWRFLGDHGWHGPNNIEHRAVSTLTLEQLAQFTSHSGHVIRPMRELMVLAAELGMTLCIEVKSPGDVEKLRDDAIATGCRVIVMTLPHLGGKNQGYRRLAAAKAVGLPTMVLLNATKFGRGQVAPLALWDHVDYVKGPTIWQHDRPARVVRLGAGSRYGVSVGPGNARRVTARLSKNPPSPRPPVILPPVVPPPHPPEVPVTSVEKLTAIAKTEVGYHEGRSGGHWNNKQKYSEDLPGADWSDGQPWCDTWVHWLFWKAGLLQLLPDVTAKAPAGSAGCDVTGNAWKRAGRWSEYPAIGAQVFFGSPRDLNHTGFVIAYDADTITTIEGNTNTNGSAEGDGVYLKTHQRRSANVVGYGYPAFAEGIVSADPTRLPPDGQQHTGVVPWRIDLIDLSHHNPDRIDWAKAKAAGVRGVYHKATQHTAFRDDMYASRRAEVRAQRLPFGAYHYAQPNKGSGTAQARFFLAVAKPRKGVDFRPMLDLEESGGLSLAHLTDWAAAWVREVKRVTGKAPVVYTKFQLTRNLGCPVWVARYNDDNAAPLPLKAWPHGWTIHQFSNGAKGVPHHVPGIDMAVDIDTLKPGFDLAKLKL